MDLATFNAHTHNYRKITRVGVDADKNFGSPQRADIIDNNEVEVGDDAILYPSSVGNSIAITVETSPSSTPV